MKLFCWLEEVRNSRRADQRWRLTRVRCSGSTTRQVLAQQGQEHRFTHIIEPCHRRVALSHHPAVRISYCKSQFQRYVRLVNIKKASSVFQGYHPQKENNRKKKEEHNHNLPNDYPPQSDPIPMHEPIKKQKKERKRNQKKQNKKTNLPNPPSHLKMTYAMHNLPRRDQSEGTRQ